MLYLSNGVMWDEAVIPRLSANEGFGIERSLARHRIATKARRRFGRLLHFGFRAAHLLGRQPSGCSNNVLYSGDEIRHGEYPQDIPNFIYPALGEG